LLVKPERALPQEMRTLLLLSLLGTVLSAQPVLDGEIGEAEWYKAAKHAMTKSAILRLLPAGDVLYLSVQLPTSAWGHIYVFDGDAIQVLHVSAAIGRLRYRRKGEEWWTADEFIWQLRDRGYSPALRAAQDKYFDENGWVGTNNNMSGKQFELKLRRAPGKAIRLAAVFAKDHAAEYYWPTNLADDTRNETLLSGSPISSPRFDPATWAKVR